MNNNLNIRDYSKFNRNRFVFLLFIFFVLFFSIKSKKFLFGIFIFYSIFNFIISLFKFILFIFSFKNKINYHIDELNDKDLPVITILIPLYKENKNTLLKLFNSIENLDYVKNKLDVILLTEADDFNCLNIIKNIKLPFYIKEIIVPVSLPRTKPKALNYGIKFAKGKYLIIYDAEDMPDQDQLKKAVYQMKKESDNIFVLQGFLKIYNHNDTIISNFFSLEYLFWFNYILKGLSFLKIPLSLGGTTNFFDLEKLKQISYWDSYNVTEDAELSILASIKGYRSSVFDSYTHEWSVVKIIPFLKQRSRWMKGFLMTFIIYFTNKKIYINYKSLILFLFNIFGTIFHFLFFPIFVIFPILYYFYFYEYSVFINFIFYLNLISFLIFYCSFGFVIYQHNDSIILIKIIYILFSPLYFLLHVFSIYIALYELIFKPFFWNKTDHLIN